MTGPIERFGLWLAAEQVRDLKAEIAFLNIRLEHVKEVSQKRIDELNRELEGLTNRYVLQANNWQRDKEWLVAERARLQKQVNELAMQQRGAK